jgi:hypothetical protein
VGYEFVDSPIVFGGHIVEELEYLVFDPNLSVIEIQRFAQEIWDSAHRNGSPVQAEALEAGIHIQNLPLNIAEIIKIKSVGARVGIDPFSLLIGAVIAGGTKVAKDIWAKIILPRLVAKYGTQAIKEKKAPADIQQKKENKLVSKDQS